VHDGVYYSSYICHGCAANQVEAAFVLCGSCCSRASTDEAFRAKTDKARVDKKLWFHLPSSGMVLCEPHIPVHPQSLPYFPKDDWFHRRDDPDDYSSEPESLELYVQPEPVESVAEKQLSKAKSQLKDGLLEFRTAFTTLAALPAQSERPELHETLFVMLNSAFTTAQSNASVVHMFAQLQSTAPLRQVRLQLENSLKDLTTAEPQAAMEIIHMTLTDAQKKAIAGYYNGLIARNLLGT
jgi:hypothetical protein